MIDISDLFNGCKSLRNIPDISIWKSNNIRKYNNIFKGCKALLEIPDISKWNYTDNISFGESASSEFSFLEGISSSENCSINNKGKTQISNSFTSSIKENAIKESSNLDLVEHEKYNMIYNGMNAPSVNYEEKNDYYENFYN